VDDEPQTCELLAEFCREHDLPSATAQDGRAAVEAIRRAPTPFTIVITDLHMPGADGFAVLHAARAANPNCYVVIVTGYGTIDTAVRAVREGAYDYLSKPFALGQLEVVIRRILDRMALERERAHLAREVEVLPGTALRDVATRLQAIEDRLARIEAILKSR
jgi:two-component system, NtrC family, response regulator HydG